MCSNLRLASDARWISACDNTYPQETGFPYSNVESWCAGVIKDNDFSSDFISAQTALLQILGFPRTLRTSEALADGAQLNTIVSRSACIR